MTESKKAAALRLFGEEIGQRVINAMLVFGPSAMDDAIEAIERLQIEVTTARAIAMEEAARHAVACGSNGVVILSIEELGAAIRALAPLPAGLVAVKPEQVADEDGMEWRAEALELRRMVAEMGLARLKGSHLGFVAVPREKLEKGCAYLREAIPHIAYGQGDIAGSNLRRGAIEALAALSALVKP